MSAWGDFKNSVEDKVGFSGSDAVTFLTSPSTSIVPAIAGGGAGGGGGIIGIGNKQETNITAVDSRQVSTVGTAGVSGSQLAEILNAFGGLNSTGLAAKNVSIPQGYSAGNGPGVSLSGLLTPTNLILGAVVIAGLYYTGVFK